MGSIKNALRKRLATLIRWAAPPAPTPTPFDLSRVMRLVNDESQPLINELTVATRNIDVMALNIKALGYNLARQLGQGLAKKSPGEPRPVGLGSKLSTQDDIESDWFAYWCHELGIAPVYHRKLWEFAYLLQMVYDTGNLVAGRRGLGFGCGSEPLASYFAGRGIDVLHTDLPPEDPRAKEWSRSNEHVASLEKAHHTHLVDRDVFFQHVQHRDLDMNDIPDDLGTFDFCWSVCAFEHLGSIERGLAFVENSLKFLRPGGVAIHTTEFNINPLGPTVDNWMTVLFQRKHIEELADRLAARGHRVATLNFDPGDKPLDQFIDLPPWHDGTFALVSAGLGQPLHLKVASDGFVVTCLGLTITRCDT